MTRAPDTSGMEPRNGADRCDYRAEVAWLLEWRPTEYMPTRYYSADHPQPVLDPNKATRFARKEDAMAAGKALGLRPSDNPAGPNVCRAVEHAWLPSAEIANIPPIVERLRTHIAHYAELVRAVRLLWQFHEPGDIPADLEISVPELLAKIHGDGR